MILFYITKEKSWKENINSDIYKDASLEKDGFIHLCAFDQIVNVANDHFKNVCEKLVILPINSDYLKSEIKWEKNLKTGITYPHLYGGINKEAIIESIDFEKDENGNFFISDKIFNYAKYEKSCGAIVIHKFEDEPKVLLINFPCGKNNFWGFPKGHIEENETEKDAAKREIFEETGLEAEIKQGFRNSTYFSYKKGATLEAVYYYATTKESKTKSQAGEVNKCSWFKLGEASKYISFDCDKNIFGNFLKFYENKMV